MSVKVVQREGQEGGAPACEPHLLPCEIQYTGSAPVSAYFEPLVLDGSRRIAHFRGRELRGNTLHLPAGYEGMVLQDTLAASIADGEERRWVQRGTFSQFTYWKHDEDPTSTDPLAKCVEWARIASVLHAHHVEEEEEQVSSSG